MIMDRLIPGLSSDSLLLRVTLHLAEALNELYFYRDRKRDLASLGESMCTICCSICCSICYIGMVRLIHSALLQFALFWNYSYEFIFSWFYPFLNRNVFVILSRYGYELGRSLYQFFPVLYGSRQSGCMYVWINLTLVGLHLHDTSFCEFGYGIALRTYCLDWFLGILCHGFKRELDSQAPISFFWWRVSWWLSLA